MTLDTTNNDSSGKIDVLLSVMAEQYQHARDHEHLRSNTTALISAGGAALIAFGEERGLVAGGLIFVLGSLGLLLNIIHKHRFDAHVAAGRYIRRSLDKYFAKGDPLPAVDSASKMFACRKHGNCDLKDSCPYFISKENEPKCGYEERLKKRREKQEQDESEDKNRFWRFLSLNRVWQLIDGFWIVTGVVLIGRAIF